MVHHKFKWVDQPISTCGSSFLPVPTRTVTEAIRNIINGIDPLDWPGIDSCPLNEFRIVGLATQLYFHTVLVTLLALLDVMQKL